MDDIDKIQDLEDTRVAERLKAISDAMSKPADDIYCVDCGDEIPEERRTLLPHATRCIECQTKHEKERRYR